MGLRATGPSVCFQGLQSVIYALHVGLLTSTINALCFPMCRPCTGGAACTRGHSLPQSTNTFLSFAFFFFQTNTNVELIGRDNTDPCSCRRLGIYGRLSWSQFYQLWFLNFYFSYWDDCNSYSIDTLGQLILFDMTGPCFIRYLIRLCLLFVRYYMDPLVITK